MSEPQKVKPQTEKRNMSNVLKCIFKIQAKKINCSKLNGGVVGNDKTIISSYDINNKLI